MSLVVSSVGASTCCAIWRGRRTATYARSVSATVMRGTIIYLENCETGSLDAARMLHGLRLAGWFDDANAVLFGRTGAPAVAGFSQNDAVLDALGRLDVPIIADVDFGHVPPGNVLANGAAARVIVDGDQREIVQTLA